MKEGTEESSGLGSIDLSVFPKLLFGLQVLWIETDSSVDPIDTRVVLE